VGAGVAVAVGVGVGAGVAVGSGVMAGVHAGVGPGVGGKGVGVGAGVGVPRLIGSPPMHPNRANAASSATAVFSHAMNPFSGITFKISPMQKPSVGFFGPGWIFYGGKKAL